MYYSNTTCNCTRRRSALSYQVGSFLSSNLRSLLTKGETFMCSRTKQVIDSLTTSWDRNRDCGVFRISALGTTNRDGTGSGAEGNGEEEEWRDTCSLAEPGNALAASYKTRCFLFLVPSSTSHSLKHSRSYLRSPVGLV